MTQVAKIGVPGFRSMTSIQLPLLIKQQDDPVQEKHQIHSTKDNASELARRILQYLQAHPRATDTLEGIVEWWLPQNRIAEAVEQVSQTIMWLVANGYLLERRVPGASVLYEVNLNKRNEIEDLLAELESSRPNE